MKRSMMVFFTAFLALTGTASGPGNADIIIPAAAAETVSMPDDPIGEYYPTITIPYVYSAGGSTSSEGHDVQYYFNFDDGTNSGWLPVGTTEYIKRWPDEGDYAGYYYVQVKARCAIHTGIESGWSEALEVYPDPILDGRYVVLPEVIWAPATGGGTWVTEVQINHFSQSDEVYVCFNAPGGTWRGPFDLWNPGGSSPSVKYDNILSELQSLDPDFDYYGKVGALQLWTLGFGPNTCEIRVAARTLNGNYSKTFPGLKSSAGNYFSRGNEPLLIQNLISNAVYRSSTGFFNAGGHETTVEFQLLDSAGSLIGSSFSRTFAPYDFQSFNPFVQAGVPYPANSYDNVCLGANVTSVASLWDNGYIYGFGALANNTSNDPAALLAAPDGQGYSGQWNAPFWQVYLPEAIWSPATGGGTWVTDIQITDVHGGSAVNATFFSGTDSPRGPFALWTGGSPHSSVRFNNILQTLQALDPSYTYYGKVGAICFESTQGSGYNFLVTAMTKNGNYSKTYPATRPSTDTSAAPHYIPMVMNLTSNATYRSSVIFANSSGPTDTPMTIECRLFDANANVVGSMFTVTLGYRQFYSVNPFAAAGVPYPANSYDNVYLHLWPTSGTGFITVYGATANNASNDPACHLPVFRNYIY
jgi:hypothetical protein